MFGEDVFPNTRARAHTHTEVNRSAFQNKTFFNAERYSRHFLRDVFMHFTTLCTRMFSEAGNPSRKLCPAISGVLLLAQRQ